MSSICEFSRRMLAATLAFLLALGSTGRASADTSLCCPADIVADGTVASGDLSRLVSQWGDAGDADLDGSGVVDGDDLALLLNSWGDCPTPCFKTRLVGQVTFPDGSPASGAIVMSEFGGIATTTGDGSFAFVVDVPSKATQASVSAVVTVGSTDYAGEAVASPIVLDGTTIVGEIAVEPEACIPSWLPTVGPAPGTNGQIMAMTTADLGSGPMLFVAGSFTSIGGVAANNIAAWDGQAWRPLGSGVTGGHLGLAPAVYALEAWDDGSGPQLFVGGQYLFAGGVSVGCISRWNGTSWASMGSGVEISEGGIRDFAVYDDGTGPALYVAGLYYTISGLNSPYVARWRNSTWSSTNGFFTNACFALAIFDDGTGEKLYVAGLFGGLGPDQAWSIASWDGTNWRSVGTAGYDGTSFPGIYAMETIQIGSESRLYISGFFQLPDGGEIRGVGYWTGTQWVQVGTDFYDVRAFEVLDDGSGPRLYAIGEVPPPAGGGAKQDGLYRWTGETWELIEPRLSASYALHSIDLGEGPEILVGGGFSTPIDSPLVLNGLARWNGQTLKTFGRSLSGVGFAMTEIPGPSGPEVVVGGSFTSAGGVPASRVVRWDGANWHALGSGLNGIVSALAMHDAGSGPQLYAGGSFASTAANRVARWNGTQWQPLGNGVGGAVNALLSYNDGSGTKLYAAGAFTTAGGATANRIARWNGASWEPVGAGFNGTVFALGVFTDAIGPALYAGGAFTSSGGVPMAYIARWNGTAWSPVGLGVNGAVRALTATDLGDGPALFVGGDFAQAGGAPASRIARWDGSSWSSLGSGVNGIVRTIIARPINGSPAIVVGGDFTQASALPSSRVAYWTGSTWGQFPATMSGSVWSLLGQGSGSDAVIFATGTFTRSPSGDAYFSRLGCPDN